MAKQKPKTKVQTPTAFTMNERSQWGRLELDTTMVGHLRAKLEEDAIELSHMGGDIAELDRQLTELKAQKKELTDARDAKVREMVNLGKWAEEGYMETLLPVNMVSDFKVRFFLTRESTQEGIPVVAGQLMQVSQGSGDDKTWGYAWKEERNLFNVDGVVVDSDGEVVEGVPLITEPKRVELLADMWLKANLLADEESTEGKG